MHTMHSTYCVLTRSDRSAAKRRLTTTTERQVVKNKSKINDKKTGEEIATVSEWKETRLSVTSYKVTVLPKLQYCRVVSRECCGAGGAAYTSDAVDRHLCSLRVPCERERRTARPAAHPPAVPAAPAPAPGTCAAPLPLPGAPPPPPGPFIYNTHTASATNSSAAHASHPYRSDRPPVPPTILTPRISPLISVQDGKRIVRAFR